MNRRLIQLVVAACALGLLTLALIALPVRAQEPPDGIEAEVLRIAKDLYCPVCVGVPLDVCKTQACVQWRGLIREKLLAGESAEQIRQYFIARYGERVLGAPPPEGFNLSAYVLPLLVLVVGALVVAWVMRSWLRARPASRAPATVPPIAPSGATPDFSERIARELRERD